MSTAVVFVLGVATGALMDIMIAQLVLSEQLGLNHPVLNWFKNRGEKAEEPELLPIIDTEVLERLREFNRENGLSQSTVEDIITSHLRAVRGKK